MLPTSSSRLVAEELLGLAVDQGDAAPRVDDDHGVGGGLEQPPEHCLPSLAFGDVPGDGRGADDPAVGGADGGHRERHPDQRAVLAHAIGFVVVDLLAPEHRFEDVEFLAVAGLGDDERDGSADGLLGAVPVEALGAAVPAHHDPLRRLGHDGVVGGVHHGREQVLRARVGDIGNRHAGSLEPVRHRPPGTRRSGHRRSRRPHIRPLATRWGRPAWCHYAAREVVTGFSVGRWLARFGGRAGDQEVGSSAGTRAGRLCTRLDERTLDECNEHSRGNRLDAIGEDALAPHLRAAGEPFGVA